MSINDRIINGYKVLHEGHYYNYYILDDYSIMIDGLNDYWSICKTIFKKQQKAIDNVKTSKEDRKLFISANKRLLEFFKERKEEIK